MNILLTLLSIFVINTAQTSLVLDIKQGEELQIVYYGHRLSDPSMLTAAQYQSHRAYAAFGLSGSDEYAISATQPDGNMTLKLAVTSWEQKDWEGGKLLCVTSHDEAYPFAVKNYYKSYEKQDMIETWAEIINEGKKTVVLNRFDSGYLPLPVGNIWISSLGGSWGSEATLTEEPLTRGYKVIKNSDGVRNSHYQHSEAMISLDGKPRENEGPVIGAALCYGGNYQLRFFCDDTDFSHFYAGMLPDNSWYHLEGGEIFKTPALAYSFSNEGLGGVSRNFHSWGRQYKLAHGNQTRDILLNSWEGVYFDIDEPVMAQMMKDIADMGGELFVMDDGWFGDKYARVVDDRGLGDWVVDRNKLPNGVQGLVQTAKKNGIKFGIWIEPEMVNIKSELFEKHPDWVMQAKYREHVPGRGDTQLVLDMSRKEVQDHVFSVVDNLMKENPEIAYMKWDSNMDMRTYGSTTLKHQSHLNIEYWRGLYAALDRIRAKYPDLIIQACASGGGRASWGVLPWFDEFWVSDNTDAVQRLYMQWGASYFFPAISMASHISASPNHQLDRMTPLKYRIDVAMSGRLGMEIQPKDMTEEEKAVCRNAIADYKKIRHIVQLGDLYRIVSPYDKKGYASILYSSEDKNEAVFYWWKMITLHDWHYGRVRFAGLDPEKLYTISEINRIDLEPLYFEGKTFSGKFLMESGLDMPKQHSTKTEDRTDWSSRILYLKAK